MITVEEAEQIVLSRARDFGVEEVNLEDCLGRVLAEEILADRDLPPFNRVTMDGIAIRFEAIGNSVSSFELSGTQLAGDRPIELSDYRKCISIMTGAALPQSADTVIPVEQIKIADNRATIEPAIVVRQFQNIHLQGKDKKQGEVLVGSNEFITPAIIAVAAAVGKSKMRVRKNPSALIISTGNELVGVEEKPNSFQIRRSNNYAIDAVLKKYSVKADIVHLPDDKQTIVKYLSSALQNYDVILLSGGVSMGSSDFVPIALEELKVKKLFHKIKQRPGKPFWFGLHADKATVFAFPGNPVSTFMCTHRYFLPWLMKCWQVERANNYAILNQDLRFDEPLQYFLQVKLMTDRNGVQIASPINGNGSGDFNSLTEADAFIELPAGTNFYGKGTVYKVWTF